MNFVWTEKGRRGRRACSKTVVLSVRKDGTVGVIFLDGTDKLVSKSGFVQFGFSEDGECLGIKEGTKDTGYKIGIYSKSNPVCKLTSKASELEKYRAFEGTHKLHSVPESRVFYITKKEVEQ